MSEGRGRGGGEGPPLEPGPDATPSADPPRPRPRPPRAGASKATARPKSAGAGAGAGKATRPAKSAAAGKDTPKPRKAEPANRATGKKAATVRPPGGTVAKKAAAPRKPGTAGSGPPASARTRSQRAEPRPETEPVPPTAPEAFETPPPRPSPPPSSPPSPPSPAGGGPGAPAWGPQGWPPPPSYSPPTSPGVDSLAITSMVLGIAAVPLFFFFVPAILAIVLGLLGRRNIKREPAKGGKGMATAGVVLGTLSLIGAILFVVGMVLSDDGSGGSLRYSSLQVGDCYDADFYDERNVDPRLCSEDHYRETFAVLDHPAPPGAEYPGRVSLRRYAERECATRFPAYVGRAYEESRLRIVVVFPPRDAWEEENLRRIVCAAARPDDEDLTRTVRDSGI